ncbi:hypothetical protein C461_10888 [Halorubrum aidingense JCM 13560]|uniref:DUF8060 domain-containing protein n=1 Tax=Halorubrum aidingense JCM 13560 TaxID=1230454 RepID=M0P943_9EURY|nr:hypothetical protein [Halorubrum aidingense]EMA66541.1 hypothetical protein C461_10888 [Halorubrum aidingense JCM 13560]
MTDDRRDDGYADGTAADTADTTDTPAPNPMTETPTDNPTDTPTETAADNPTNAPTDNPAEADPKPESTATGSRAPSDSDRSDQSTARFDRFSTPYLRGLLDRVGLAALVLLALIAGWSFYSQTGTAIRTWLDPAYQPIALAAFNLAVLLVALAGVAHQLSRIRKSEPTE